MNNKRIVLTVMLAALLAPASWGKNQHAGDGLLVDAEWISAQSLTDVTILDVGRNKAEYLLGHVPGAVFVDRSVVWGTVDELPGMLPPTGAVVESLREVGVNNETTVVVYDGGNGLWASRLFWALEYLGHTDVRVLDGGLSAWKGDGNSTVTKVPEVVRGAFTARPREELLADFDWLLASHDDAGVKVIDTRSVKEYEGTDVRADRGGHIPGAVHIDWVENLPDDGGSFKSLADLEDLYVSRDISKTDTVVTHCQTGVRGAHTYLALRLLGYEDVRLYDGSWAEWGNSTATPID